jgi:hypothetical protein
MSFFEDPLRGPAKPGRLEGAEARRGLAREHEPEHLWGEATQS